MGQITEIEALAKDIEKAKSEGKKVVHCHGTFDLLHPGHLRHFEEAKRQGDLLIVTLTAAKFVNKGPGRPVYNDQLRLEFIGALDCVDYVAIVQHADAIDLIRQLKPSIYVKGKEYQDYKTDVTGKITGEVNAVKEGGGEVYFTEDPVIFSSTKLLNNFFGSIPKEIRDFVDTFKTRFDQQKVFDVLDSMRDLKVLVVGDAIIDEYQYVDPLGQSGKGVHLVAKCKNTDVFAGGVFAVANQVAKICDQVTLLTAVGRECPHMTKVSKELLNDKVEQQFIRLDNEITLNKKRYVMKDGSNITKLFETYSGHDTPLTSKPTEEVVKYLDKAAEDFDLVIMCDYGNGFSNNEIIEKLSSKSKFLAVNAQINSGNRGYNVVTHYPKASYASLNEPELRLTTHDKYGDLNEVSKKVMELLNCDHLSCTRGTKGVLLYDREGRIKKIPALSFGSVDRVGAGDSYFCASAMALAKGADMELAGFLGSVVASMNVMIVANQKVITPAEIKKYIITLLK